MARCWRRNASAPAPPEIDCVIRMAKWTGLLFEASERAEPVPNRANHLLIRSERSVPTPPYIQGDGGAARATSGSFSLDDSTVGHAEISITATSGGFTWAP